jgi:hypothetical protein
VIRIACLGIDHRIRPCGRDYDGPSGPLLGARPIEKDARGVYQIINYFHVLCIRVPPLHTWVDGYIIQPDYPPRDVQGTRASRLTIELSPLHGRGYGRPS